MRTGSRGVGHRLIEALPVCTSCRSIRDSLVESLPMRTGSRGVGHRLIEALPACARRGRLDRCNIVRVPRLAQGAHTRCRCRRRRVAACVRGPDRPSAPHALRQLWRLWRRRRSS